MIRGTRVMQCAAWATALFLGACSPPGGKEPGGKAPGAEAPPAPEMPAHWKVTSDFQAPVEQVKALTEKLGARLSSVRNTVYDVNGKRVQINVIVTPDAESAAKLMTKLRSMKVEEALLQKDLIAYEFVGQNDVLDLIAEGRKHLESM